MTNRFFCPNFKRSLQIALLSIVVIVFTMTGAHSQSAADIKLSAPDTSLFPEISTTFNALTIDGSMIRDIQPQEIKVLENGQSVDVKTLSLVENGIRLIVAVNEGPALANQYSGITRFEMFKTGLFNWITTRSADTPDEFSLFTSYGSLNLDAKDPETWENALQTYQPDLRNAEPNLKCLSDALNDAIKTGAEASKTAAILFITSLPRPSQFAQLEEIVKQAQENEVRIFIWLVGPQDYASAANVKLLQEYAQLTGGNYFLFSGTETLPFLSDWLDPLSYRYRLSYITPIKSSGDFSLKIEFTRGDVYHESEPVTFSLSVLPPNPMFLAPPSIITRSWTETRKNTESILIPESTPIQILVEYPDGMDRSLEFSRLFVDNRLMDENTSPPFDSFTWNISDYRETKEHTLQVIIQDNAGIKGETITIPVEVVVEEKPMAWWERFQISLNPLTIVISILTVVMLLGGIVALIRLRGKGQQLKQIQQMDDPLTQLVDIAGEYVLPARPDDEVVDWPVIRGIGFAPARLLRRRKEGDDPVVQKEIPLAGEELVIGSEGRKADIVLHHPSVSPVHARIFKDIDGDYRVADSGSLAGTWVNYAPVSPQGIKLTHGDRVQFGRVGFIFEIHGAQPRRLQVIPYPEEL